MIAYVKGTIAEITENNVVIEIGGVGVNIKISGREAQSLPGVGQEIKLHTYTLVREDSFSLYGFLTRDDLNIFKKCITVNGIGPKAALSILSVLDADALRYAILTDDVKTITKAPGIGAKTANRLILDLKDKVAFDDSMIDREVSLHQMGVPAAEGDIGEAVEALVALGYGQAESLKAVGQIPDAENLDSGKLLKAALKKLF